jgi:hypothetical protein
MQLDCEPMKLYFLVRPQYISLGEKAIIVCTYIRTTHTNTYTVQLGPLYIVFAWQSLNPSFSRVEYSATSPPAPFQGDRYLQPVVILGRKFPLSEVVSKVMEGYEWRCHELQISPWRQVVE